MRKTTATVIIPIINSMESFTLEMLYSTGLKKTAISSTVSKMKRKGLLNAVERRNGATRYFVYTKSDLWNMDALKEFSVTSSDKSGHLEQLTAAKFKGTVYDAAQICECPISTLKSKLQRWHSEGYCHIAGYEFRAGAGQPTKIYKFTQGKDADIEKCLPTLKKVPYIYETPIYCTPPEVRKAFKNRASLVVYNGVKYVNPKSSQWAHHG